MTADPAKARALVDLLCDCTDLSADRSRLDSYFLRSAPSSARQQQQQDTVAAGGLGAAAQVGRACDTSGDVSPPRSVWDLFATASRGHGGDGTAPSPPQGLPPELTSPARPVWRPPSPGAGPVLGQASCPPNLAPGSSQQRLYSLFKPASGPAELDAPSPTFGCSVASLAAAAIHGSRQSGAWRAVSSAVAPPAAPVLPPQAAAREADAAAGPPAACSSGTGTSSPGASGPPLPAAAVQGSADMGGSCSGGCNSAPSPSQEEAPREGPAQEGRGQDEEMVDLSQVDVREQERILAAIAAARRSSASPGSNGGAGGAGRRASGGGGTGTKLKQGSLRVFFGVHHP